MKTVYPSVYLSQISIVQGRAVTGICFCYYGFWSSNGWTLERRARQSALIHQWRPWDKSTGPTLVSGKAAASRNAYKGGIRPVLRGLAKLLRN
jgi:hypothetical protein